MSRAHLRGGRALLPTLRGFLRVGGALALFTASGAAQSPSASQRATREQLTMQLSADEQQLASGAAKGSERSRIESEVAILKNRLENGDFKVGDRFVVTIVRDEVTSDTASVRDGLVVAIANLPDMSLKGVLRSELNDRLSAHVARYLRNATVRSNVLTRVKVVGAVGHPGFFLASPDKPLEEVVMLAGGPTGNANLNQLEIYRSGTKLLSAKDSKKALKEGKTLEQLDVQSGDDVRIPEKRKINWQLIVSSLTVLAGLIFAFIQFLQWYYGREE